MCSPLEEEKGGRMKEGEKQRERKEGRKEEKRKGWLFVMCEIALPAELLLFEILGLNLMKLH